jgi:transposase
VIEATKEGLSSREIAKELGVSHSTVNRIRRRHKFKVINGGKGVEPGTHPKEVFQCSNKEKEGDGDDCPPF